jgi:RHS repeat-associated protein
MAQSLPRANSSGPECKKCEFRDANDAVTLIAYPQGQYVGTTKYFYFRDHLGSIREMMRANGTLVARFDYDPWGRSTAVLNTTLPDFNFTGLYRHSASNLDMAVRRFYDPDLGRWINRDPIEERAGVNLYAYVSNDPVDRIDRLGLKECWPGPAPGELYLPPVPLYLPPEGENPVIPNPTFPVTGCLIALVKCLDCCATEYATCPTNQYDQHKRCEHRCQTLYEYCKDTQR